MPDCRRRKEGEEVEGEGWKGVGEVDTRVEVEGMEVDRKISPSSPSLFLPLTPSPRLPMYVTLTKLCIMCTL